MRAAETRLNRIPYFLRAMVKKGVERHAKEHDISIVTIELMEELRQKRFGNEKPVFKFLMNVLQEVFLDLNKVLPILNHWLHLMSAIVWIGGLAFLVMAVTPGLKASVPREYIKPICDTFYKQYRKIVGMLMVVILFTGGLNLHYVGELMEMQTGEGIFP